ncbi:hypothetical protein TMES_00425 [Thalassospira mesophila]|uniref:Uncharacterized protein n=1 Tax=Thalassospira mesophila TaxID=1293891 RepID=A0A1Y2L3D5_9PROT|nr:hypothetical protein TMES_00425 [Thalassospira mesophila]
MASKHPDKAVATIAVEENCFFRRTLFTPGKDSTAPAPTKSILIVSQAHHANASHYRDLLSKTGQYEEYPTGLSFFANNFYYHQKYRARTFIRTALPIHQASRKMVR